MNKIYYDLMTIKRDIYYENIFQKIGSNIYQIPIKLCIIIKEK